MYNYILNLSAWICKAVLLSKNGNTRKEEKYFFHVISVNPLRITAMYKNTRTYTMLVWQFGSVFQGKIILQVAALFPDPTLLGSSWCCLMWSPYVCSTSTSHGSSRRLLCRKNGYLSAVSKNFLQMDPTNWQRWGIPPRPPILVYCIEHHSDILL